jgi:cytosine/creatinine deaminase
VAELILRDARIDDDRGLVDIRIAGGRIVSIGAGLTAARDAEEISCAGQVVIPGLIESHVHLDKALLDRERPNLEGTLAAAIKITGDLKRSFTPEAVRARTRRVLDQAIMNGTTAVRTHPDVDPIVGLMTLDVMLELRDEYRNLVDLQVVAFPQEGILRAPGTEALLREALRRGADVVGGCSYNEADLAGCRRHVDLVFELATEYGVPVDIHADFGDDAGDPRFALASYIAAATERAGLSGRVALGHMTSLAGRPPAERAEVMARLAQAGVAVVPLPATDMHLGGRGDTTNVRRGIAPIRELWEAGVTTAYSSNNVRNAFTPYGNADLLDIGLFLAQTCHLSGPGDLARILDMATVQAARVIGTSGRYGLSEGADADLVVLGTGRVADVLLDRPDRRYVIKRGRVVARTERTSDLIRA